MNLIYIILIYIHIKRIKNYLFYIKEIHFINRETRIVRKWNNYNVLETISVTLRIASKEIITRITKYLATSTNNFSSFHNDFYVLNVAEK